MLRALQLATSLQGLQEQADSSVNLDYPTTHIFVVFFAVAPERLPSGTPAPALGQHWFEGAVDNHVARLYTAGSNTMF